MPEWMQLGVALFDALAVLGQPHEIHEVFPTASYRMLAGHREPAITLNLESFALGPKDMLDACVAAVTVREYHLGRGSAVGGGDGLGAIILPRPIEENHPVHHWPPQ